MTEIKLTDEEQIVRVRVLKCDRPEFWYSKEIGHEFDAIDSRYKDTYKVINGSSGYINKSDAEIISVIQNRVVPDFPFRIKITQNTWGPDAWYRQCIGMEFEVISGGIVWAIKNKNGKKGVYSVEKKDCEII